MRSAFVKTWLAIGLIIGGLSFDATAAHAACDSLCQAKCNYNSDCIAKWSEINGKGHAYARQKENEMRQADPALAQRMNGLDCKYHTRYCQR